MLRIDSVSPARAHTGTWIDLQGAGFRPTEAYKIHAVVFESSVDGSIGFAEFTHVLVPGTAEISDTALRARVPAIADGGARLWVTAFRIHPPGPTDKPDPGDPLPPLEEPNIEHFTSNRHFFLVLCGGAFTTLTEATMPPAVASNVENGILEFQALFGGVFVVPVDDITRGKKCWGFRVRDIEARIAINDDGVATGWNDDLWTVAITARIDVVFRLFRRHPDTLCQWLEIPGSPFKLGGDGHRWTITSVPCGDGACELVLHHAGSNYEMGDFGLGGIPDWIADPLRDDINREIRAASLGEDGAILQLVQTFAAAGYRNANDCPPPDLSDVCVSRRVVSPLANGGRLLRTLRSFRDDVLAPSRSGRSLTALYYVLSGPLEQAVIRDPVLRAQALSMLQELAAALRVKDARKRVPLNRDRLVRLRAMLARAQRQLSPDTAAALHELDKHLDPMVGKSTNALRRALTKWTFPRALRIFLDRMLQKGRY